MIGRNLHSHTIIDSPQETMLFIFFGWLFVAMVFAVLAYAYPIRSRSDPTAYRITLSVTLAVFFPPAFLVWLAWENPVRNISGEPALFLTVVSLPIYFCVAPTDYWDTYQPKKLNNIRDDV
jgi:CDP-diglyceride synthetase